MTYIAAVAASTALYTWLYSCPKDQPVAGAAGESNTVCANKTGLVKRYANRLIPHDFIAEKIGARRPMDLDSSRQILNSVTFKPETSWRL